MKYRVYFTNGRYIDIGDIAFDAIMEWMKDGKIGTKPVAFCSWADVVINLTNVTHIKKLK